MWSSKGCHTLPSDLGYITGDTQRRFLTTPVTCGLILGRPTFPRIRVQKQQDGASTRQREEHGQGHGDGDPCPPTPVPHLPSPPFSLTLPRPHSPGCLLAQLSRERNERKKGQPGSVLHASTALIKYLSY